jgi:peptidoglycan/LPS O-acetylase OafA/YrhL
MPLAPRTPLLDRLRTIGVLGIVASHAMVPYVVGAPACWYVLDAQRSIVFDGMGLLTEALLVPLLLFVVGTLTPDSLGRRGARAYVGKRALRLLVPFVLAMLMVLPFADWLRVRAAAPHIGLLDHWPRYWQYDLNHGHLWFLPFAFVLAVAAAAGKSIRPGAFRSAQESPVRGPPALALVAFVLAIGLAKGVTLCFFGDLEWINSPVLNTEPSRVPINVGFFLLGMVASFARWHEVSRSSRRMAVAGAVAVVLGAAYIAFEAFERPPATFGLKLADGVLQTGFALCLVLFLFESARTPRREGTRMGAALARSTYAIFLVHYVPVMGLGYLLRPVDWPVGLKFAVVALASFAASWAAAEVLRRIPGARRVLG